MQGTITDIRFQSNLPKIHAIDCTLRKSMSSIVFGIHWDAYFPFNFESQGCTAEYVSPGEGLTFLQKNYAEIHNSHEDETVRPFFKEDFTEAKLRYYEELGDFFLVKECGEPVGLIVGSLTDWSSYNFRSSSFLRRFQGSGVHTKLLSSVIQILKVHGVARAEADASPSNFATLQVLMRSRFNITGLNLTERWGALIHLTQYLQEAPEIHFLDSFCSGPRRQLEHKEKKAQKKVKNEGP
jgi:GNAT superfamily N-acetyltransferase